MGSASNMEPEERKGPLNEVEVIFRKEAKDALELLTFAVETGFKSADGTTVSAEIIETIKGSVVIAAETPTGAMAPKQVLEQWLKLQSCYHQLVLILTPITIETLRATASAGGAVRWFSPGAWFGESLGAAQRFARGLFATTILFAAFIVFAGWMQRAYGPVAEVAVDLSNSVLLLMELLLPFSYGGLGACVFLLRTAHTHIHSRSFDPRRKPEYMNRILLGAVAGGTITLFVNQVTTDDGQAIQLSAAALGFLAGYSTDFLYTAIERLIGAILPKVGIETMQVARTPVKPVGDALTSGMTLKELTDRFETATGDDKTLYKTLIERLRDRI